MTTAKQRAANRRNARKSTGPRTEAGKVASSRNALTHGLAAEHHFVEGEDPMQFEELRTSLTEQVQPVSVMEKLLVERMAATFWRLRRVPAIEAAVIEALAHPRDASSVPTQTDPNPPKKRGRPPLSPQPGPAAPPHLTIGQAFHLALSNNILDKISRYDAALMNQLMRTEEQLKLSIYQRHQHMLAEAATKRPADAQISAEDAFKKIRLA